MGFRMAVLDSRWARPAAMAAVVELITIAGTGFGPHRSGRLVDIPGAALLAIAAGAPAFARRWPAPSVAASLTATVVFYGFGYPTDSPFFVGLLVTLYVTGAAGARVRAGIIAVLTVLLFVGAALLGHTADRSIGFAEGIIVVSGLLAGQVAAEWRARADRHTERTREEEALRRLAEERLRIARELHDVVSHSIAMINVQAGVAVHVMDDRPEEARAALVAIKLASRDALRDLRGILGLLRQTDDAEPRSPAAGLGHVPSLAETVRRAGIGVALRLEAGDSPLPVSIDLAAYRVIQEALTNVVRHAPGAAATVTVRRLPDALVVEVEDDGRTAATVAADGRQGAGHGLAGMRERVRAAGGSVEAGAREGGGFAVRATLPLDEGNEGRRPAPLDPPADEGGRE